MRQLSAKPARGMTLIELMVGLSISAVLALAAMPFLGDYIANSRLREAGHALYSETLFAQSEAQKRNVRVRLQLQGSTVRTLDMSAGGAGVLLREFGFAAPVVAAANVDFDFGSNGRPVAAVDLGANLAITGQSCSADRRCPGLRVDAGGAVRLCSDHLNACD